MRQTWTFLSVFFTSASALAAVSPLKLTETWGQTSRSYELGADGSLVVVARQKGTGLSRAGLNFSPRAALRRTFLPVGFPDSVPAEYLAYQRYHVVQVGTFLTPSFYALSA